MKLGKLAHLPSTQGKNHLKAGFIILTPKVLKRQCHLDKASYAFSDGTALFVSAMIGQGGVQADRTPNPAGRRLDLAESPPNSSGR